MPYGSTSPTYNTIAPQTGYKITPYVAPAPAPLAPSSTSLPTLQSLISSFMTQQSPTQPVGFPPPPTLPPPPSVPTFTSPYQAQLQQLLSSLQNYNPMPALTAQQQAMLDAQTNAQLSSANQEYNAPGGAFDKQLANLYGSGVERSTISQQAAADLSGQYANTKAQIYGDAANRALQLEQYLGQQGLSALGAQGGLINAGLGTDASLYGTRLNALLNEYGQQSQNALGLYGQQSQNALGQGQLSLAQQQMQMDALKTVLGLFSSMMGGFGGGSLGGAPSIGGISGGLGGSTIGGGSVYGSSLFPFGGGAGGATSPAGSQVYNNNYANAQAQALYQAKLQSLLQNAQFQYLMNQYKTQPAYQNQLQSMLLSFLQQFLGG